MAKEEVLVEKAGRTVLLTINREGALNALNNRIMLRLQEIFETLEEDETPWLSPSPGQAPGPLLQARHEGDQGCGKRKNRVYYKRATNIL